MRTFGFFVGFGACVTFAACGGATDSPLLGDGGTTTQNDGAPSTDGNPTTDGPAPNPCDVSRCATIPQGFQAVRPSDVNTACPAEWTSTDLVSAPVAGDGACTCGCNVTQAPSCEGGVITRYGDVGNTATCGTQATSITATAACTYINASVYLQYYHYSASPPPAQGGACEFDAQTDASKVSSTPVRVCAPPSQCVGEICDGSVCVAQDGDVSCPADFPTKTLVGKSATATCGTCGGTCTPKTTCNGTLALFEDAQCSLGEMDFPTDGTCNTNTAVNAGPYYYAEFKPAPTTPACGGTPTPPTATASLDTPTTVCCK